MSTVLPYGEDALLLDCADTAEVLGWAAWLRDDPPYGVVEVVPAARTLLLRLAPGADVAAISTVLQGPPPGPPPAPDPGAVVTIDVRYDGPDLAAAAGLCGVDEAALVAAHSGARYSVAFVGFAPGFGYLTGLPVQLHVPRLAEPRARVPAGSVGLAGEFTGVYPRESPGGWQLIGRTEAVLWDIDRDPPGLLMPGTTVAFRAVDGPC